ncbi:MAG: AAA family ATPase [Magnetococcales bacterium]|nr:AAA family ATPase [Magnetococcales bacterium]
MYLKHLYIENSGPIRHLDLPIPLKENGTPKPLILVGENGAGKTILLSLIADALIEAAAVHYTDIVPGSGTPNRPWFRILGPTTLSAGSDGGCAILHFEHDGENSFYCEKIGNLSTDDVKMRAPESLISGIRWDNDVYFKKFFLSDDKSRKIFESGSYLFFPSSRAETPHWLNKESIPENIFNNAQRISKRLQKPIYVEQGLDLLHQWMLTLLIDTRIEITPTQTNNGTFQIKTCIIDNQEFMFSNSNIVNTYINNSILFTLNSILKLIFNIREESASLKWINRFYHQIFFAMNNIDLPIHSLSAGQAILFNIFGTLMRYGDGLNNTLGTAENISGICIIDEIDAHMHIDLQNRALPELIKMFPKVQFILSCHSPLFVLGAEKILGEYSVSIVNMPDGTLINSEAYTEFGQALCAFQETKAYQNKIQAALEKMRVGTKPLLVTEGKTDIEHLKMAMKILKIDDLDVEFLEDVDEKGGYSNLLKLLEQRSRLPETRIIVGIFDRDEKEPLTQIEKNNGVYKDYGNNVFAICLPCNDENKHCCIEHYYPDRILKKENEGRRIFTASEFYPSGKSEDGIYNLSHGLNKDKLSKDSIIDYEVYKINDLKNSNNIAMSKTKFAQLIQSPDFIGDFNFESFRPIFDRLREIPGLAATSV